MAKFGKDYWKQIINEDNYWDGDAIEGPEHTVGRDDMIQVLKEMKTE